MKHYRHVLAAVEASPKEALFVASRAAELAEATGATLTLIHVIEPRYAEIANPPVQDSIIDHAQEILDMTASKLSVKPDRVIVNVGSVRSEICATAEYEHADLIVVGTHGRHAIGRMLGSTASAVVHSALCDILVVHMLHKEPLPQ